MLKEKKPRYYKYTSKATYLSQTINAYKLFFNMQKMSEYNANVLSQRYATPEMNTIFSERGRLLSERNLWIAVMKAQKELGVPIPSENIEKYERAKEDINPKAIEARERELRHDVKAKIEAFVQVSGAKEYIHKAMTSRDLTDNVEQMQIRQAGKIILGKYVSMLRYFDDKSQEYKDILLTARTHHQPAQPTLLGRRIAMWEEELIEHFLNFEIFLEDYPLRGIKGPVGTQEDMLALLGSKEKVAILEQHVADELGFKRVLNAPGQIYPRSLDYDLISHLSLLAAAPQNFANGMRLMAGYELITEGFKEGQVGSSAMPHKMNTRTSERIHSLAELLKMHVDGASRLSGAQWEEGDVSCSALRRIVIPDAFYTSDGLCEATLTVLNEMGTYPVMIAKEVDRYLPFLATTELLTLATQKGIGREEAHKIIRDLSVKEALRMRQGEEQQLAQKLLEHPRFQEAGIQQTDIQKILDERKHFVGNAYEQIQELHRQAQDIINAYPQEAAYEPRSIL